jgi:hypothetical protein
MWVLLLPLSGVIAADRARTDIVVTVKFDNVPS